MTPLLLLPPFRAGSSVGAASVIYCVTVRLTDVLPYDDASDDVTGWSVERSMKDFNDLYDKLKKVSFTSGGFIFSRRRC